MALVDVGRQILVGRQKFVPPRYGIAVLTSGDVGGEILDVHLDPGSIGQPRAYPSAGKEVSTERPSTPRTRARDVPRFGAP
jgi:hypothetical protein